MSEPAPSASDPKKKRQHFVPKFYLRNFSFDGGNRLHLVHVETLRSIPGIGLNGQCYGDYFYGKDPVVENALRDMEGVTAGLFRDIIADQRLPALGTPEDLIFRTFVCLQWGRTKSHAENSEALFSKAFKTVYAPQWRAAGISQEEIDQLEIGTEKPGLFSLGMTADMVPFMGDLESKLIVAGSLGEFVTSDTPVVLTNPYYLVLRAGVVALIARLVKAFGPACLCVLRGKITRTTPKNIFPPSLAASCPYSPFGFGRCGVWVPAR